MGKHGEHGPYRVGERIPGTQYKFLDVLGSGGHGVVVRAEHVFLGKRVAIKLLHPDNDEDGELVERMLAEARLLARVEHPNIVSVIDGGMTADRPSRPYFVMDELTGKPLSAVLKNMPNGVGLAPSLELTLGVLDGLDYAHTQCGVIHRDVKPANIFLHRSATDTTVSKVLDFGIAHFAVRAAGRTGKKFIGTPRYVAPEQILGETPSARTDVYAVGLVLYECLYGQSPFVRFQEFAAIAHAHLSVMPAPLGELMDGVPPALDALLMAMLAKDPSARPASAAAAAVKLRTIAEDLRRAADRLTHKVQHRTEPTPLANMMVTTRAPGSEPRLEAHDTAPDAYAAADANTTEPGAPPFDDVQSDTSPMNGVPFASTKPSRALAGGVDRNAETRLRNATPPQPGPRFDTDPMTGGRARDAASDPPAAAETPFTSTAGVVSNREPAAAATRARKRSSALLAGAAVVVIAAVGVGAFATRHAASAARTSPPTASTPNAAAPPAASVPSTPLLSSASVSTEPRVAQPSASASTAPSTSAVAIAASPRPPPSAIAAPRPHAAPRSSAPSPSAIGFE